MKRCVNLDWLEVFTHEPLTQPRDADYFREHGFNVNERQYGTRVYKQMFTLMGTDDLPLLEIRREPASTGPIGIYAGNECHIRLHNRTCYFDNAAQMLIDFLNAYGYADTRISRVDVCLDFSMFDSGDDPQKFVRRYLQHKYAKINQGEIKLHGEDNWSCQEWHSLSWGSRTSAVSTKMYDKTLELYDPKTASYKKPYIRYAWYLCGLIDDYEKCTLNGEKVTIWRVEFSIKSDVKNWVRLELNGKAKDYQSIPNRLECYVNRGKLLTIFASLAQHYFHFKKYTDGQRKDRCEDKQLFHFDEVQEVFKVGRNSTTLSATSDPMRQYNKLIIRLEEFMNSIIDRDVKKATRLVIEKMEELQRQGDIPATMMNQVSDELLFIIRDRLNRPAISDEVRIAEYRNWMRISENVLPF